MQSCMSMFINATALKKDAVGEERYCGPNHEQMLILFPSTLRETIHAAVCKSTIFYIYHLLNHQWYQPYQIIFIWKRYLIAQEEAWSHSQRKCGYSLLSRCLCQCLNPQELTQCCYSEKCPPPASICYYLPHSNCTWNKKEIWTTWEIAASVHWLLLTFAKTKTFCSSMSFPPASKKLLSPFPWALVFL